MMRADIVDPPAYSPPYDHALAAALVGQGVHVRLFTSRFAYGATPEPAGYARELFFYRHARGPAGSGIRAMTKLAEHVPDMSRYRRAAAACDVAHFQWLTLPRLDLRLLPDRPVVLTIHDPLERGGHRGPIPASAFTRVAAIVVHTRYARERVVAQHGLDPEMVHVIPHGVLAVSHGARAARGAEGDVSAARALPPELPDTDLPVVLCFGLIRPYKGIDQLLRAWRGITGAQLWIVGRPMMDLAPLAGLAPPGVQFLPRFVTASEQAALYDRADIAVLPYERSERFGFSGVLATALGAGKAIILSDVGGLAEVAGPDPADPAVWLVPPGDEEALHAALSELISAPAVRARLAAAARRAARETYSWEAAARETRVLYAKIGAA